MGAVSSHTLKLSPEQQAIRAKCFHPTGQFKEFPKEDLEKSISARFEKIVREYPDRIAVKTSTQAYTYAELSAIVDRVARTILAHQGIKDDPVGLLFDRGSASLVTGMLGVLKAGKMFVLLDSSFPQATIAAILEDSQASVVMADRENISLATEVAGPGCPVMARESVDVAEHKSGEWPEVSPQASACIFYTSGSTGPSKGVLWRHRNILHQTMLFANTYHGCAEDKISLLTAGTGNAVTNALFAVLTGATLLQFDVRKEGSNRLANWLSRENVSICFIGVPLFRNLCETLTGEETFPALRLVWLKSQSVYKTDFDLYKKYFPRHCLLANGLASSEAGFLTVCFFDQESQIFDLELPVGYPVADKEVVLLDDNGEKLGFNTIGEIAVRSPFLPTGYWRRPDLTVRSLKLDPLPGHEDLYLTGDLGMMLANGCLVHKGRKDFRVKIRGFAVDTAEVEAVLRQHVSVGDAVVVTKTNESGETFLVAYFTARLKQAPSVSELRRFLQKKLNDYMIPSAFVLLKSLPLMANGKLNREAVPDADKSRPELDTPFIAPRTPLEKKLAQIWAHVLSLDRVGLKDSFFDLGGHSLSATRIVSQLVKQFRLEIPLQCLFESPTVAEMAAVVAEHQAKKIGKSELEQILTEVESLSEEDARQFLTNATRANAVGEPDE